MQRSRYEGYLPAFAESALVVRVAGTLLLTVVLWAVLSGCRKPAELAEGNTPQAAFSRIQKAGLEGDIETYYDLCDEKGQAGLCEMAFQMITMEIYDRNPNRATDAAGIQRAFQEELDLSPAQVEKSQSDPKVRKDVFLQILRRSRGLVPDTLKEGLAELAKHEVLSCEIEREGVARLQLRSASGEKTWYMVLEGGNWVIAGGMSPYRPEN